MPLIFLPFNICEELIVWSNFQENNLQTSNQRLRWLRSPFKLDHKLPDFFFFFFKVQNYTRTICLILISRCHRWVLKLTRNKKKTCIFWNFNTKFRDPIGTRWCDFDDDFFYLRRLSCQVFAVFYEIRVLQIRK